MKKTSLVNLKPRVTLSQFTLFQSSVCHSLSSLIQSGIGSKEKRCQILNLNGYFYADEEGLAGNTVEMHLAHI